MDKNREQLSCLMDGEVETGSAAFLVRRLASDLDMKQAWQRYHLVRSVLHQESTGPLNLAGRVSLALDAEVSPERPGSRAPGWLRTATGGALAASVALAAIIGINQNLLNLGGEDELNADQPGFVSHTTPLDRQFTRQPVPVSFTAGAEQSSPAHADRQRIHSYLVRHNQAAGGTGFISYTPILTARTEAMPDKAVLKDQPESAEKDPEPAPR